ncbi:hypothetical protein SteCoe_10607 [Stentor coeruleus]|uniref:EF-hand domain-containing protein n=1 Tax=Stentor coeruleus TaxID=5963 RepID=A0A1R2CF87_9CILI|nr:hypothetical protein SteCoe_10607 [Stentor coeruleus]
MDELPQLLRQSPNLQTINLEFSEIESLDPLMPWLIQFSRLKELQLFGNRLETLPKDLSKLRSLEKLDISNNLIASIDLILPGLLSLPNLIELHVTLQDFSEEQLLLNNLPKLQNLNGNPVDKYRAQISVQEQDSDDEKDLQQSLLACQSSGFFSEETSLNQEYLEKIAVLYDEIRALWVKEDKKKDSVLAEDFDEGLKKIMGELSDVLKDNKQEYLINVYSLKAKFDLALLCQGKLLDLSVKKNDKLGGKLKESNDLLVQVFRETISCMASFEPKIRKKISSMKNQVSHFQKESEEVLEAADQLQKEAKVHKEAKEFLIKRFQDEKDELLAEIEALQEENKKYLDTIIRHSKSYAEGVLSSRGSEDLRNEDDSRKYSMSSPSMVKQNGKVLSIKQLKEVIEEIYASKVKYDERCSEGKMPRETMEEHMYNYLNKKYGLRNLILEWAASIIASVKKYAQEDNDVAVFGLILKNECDEEFRFVQVQVKKTVTELLRINLRNKFPLKSAGDINEMVNERTGKYLAEDEWNEIVRFMYNESDAEYIVDQLYSQRIKDELPTDRPTRGKVSREEAIIQREKERGLKNRILYSEFVNFLLDFQLHGHQKFLSNFVKVFKKVDMDSDGILNEKEFTKLLATVNLGFNESDCNRLLQLIDPFDNQNITFSECVALFSTELVPVENVPIMQKISGDS